MSLRALSEWPGISDDGPWNLVDILQSPKLENFVAGTCGDMMGPDPHRCLILMRGLRIMGEFMQTRGEMNAQAWKGAQAELARLENLAHRMRGRG